MTRNHPTENNSRVPTHRKRPRLSAPPAPPVGGHLVTRADDQRTVNLVGRERILRHRAIHKAANLIEHLPAPARVGPHCVRRWHNHDETTQKKKTATRRQIEQEGASDGCQRRVAVPQRPADRPRARARGPRVAATEARPGSQPPPPAACPPPARPPHPRPRWPMSPRQRCRRPTPSPVSAAAAAASAATAAARRPPGGDGRRRGRVGDVAKSAAAEPGWGWGGGGRTSVREEGSGSAVGAPTDTRKAPDSRTYQSRSSQSRRGPYKCHYKRCRCGGCVLGV